MRTKAQFEKDAEKLRKECAERKETRRLEKQHGIQVTPARRKIILEIVATYGIDVAFKRLKESKETILLVLLSQ